MSGEAMNKLYMFFTSYDEIKVILTQKNWVFFGFYKKFIEEEKQILHFFA